MRLNFDEYRSTAKRLLAPYRVSEAEYDIEEEYKDYVELIDTFGEGELVVQMEADGKAAICVIVSPQQKR